MSSDQPTSRFAPQNKTTNERLSTTTVGLVALSDFRKRRAEVLEAQVREAREAVLAAPTPPVETTPNNDNSNNVTSDDSGEVEKHRKKKAKKTKTAARARALVSFDDGDGEEDEEATPVVVKKGKSKAGGDKSAEGKDEEDTTNPAKTGSKVGANASVAVVPRVLTKAALRREAAERDALRKQFLLLQAAVKATEVAIPFVFYDGTNTPGGIVRVKKGDHAWLFLDKSRKVGAELGVGGEKSANARRDWARVGVDDLMLVRGSIIIPHVSFKFGGVGVWV
jgi:protein FAM50